MLYHKKCEHERHQAYLHVFHEYCPEPTYLRHISLFVCDPNISLEDDEDLELFQDLLFEGPMGRIHIFYYEELFRSSYSANSALVLMTFSRYLQFLDMISSLFVVDAYHFIFRQDDPILIDELLKRLPFKLKMSFLSEAQKKPGVIRLSEKLKLLNLFS